jgi:hypothetical protein
MRERAAFKAPMDVFRAWPGATVIYYSKYERTEYLKLQRSIRTCAATGRSMRCMRRAGRWICTSMDRMRDGGAKLTCGYAISIVAEIAYLEERIAFGGGYRPRAMSASRGAHYRVL